MKLSDDAVIALFMFGLLIAAILCFSLAVWVATL